MPVIKNNLISDLGHLSKLGPRAYIRHERGAARINTRQSFGISYSYIS